MKRWTVLCKDQYGIRSTKSMRAYSEAEVAELFMQYRGDIFPLNNLWLEIVRISEG